MCAWYHHHWSQSLCSIPIRTSPFPDPQIPDTNRPISSTRTQHILVIGIPSDALDRTGVSPQDMGGGGCGETGYAGRLITGGRGKKSVG